MHSAILPSHRQIMGGIAPPSAWAQDKSEWKASKLAAKLAVSPECLRRHIYYWLARGVVTEGKLSRGDVMYKAAGEMCCISAAVLHAMQSHEALAEASWPCLQLLW